ncbi:MAG: GntR family transcriptional regulator [Calditrichaeota bacterium]|nr:GntR family transcriptional regulator [Calditrichota bacterium]MCB0301102.1 GntR family transcriptional regulator [Calditrichota bacterium]
MDESLSTSSVTQSLSEKAYQLVEEMIVTLKMLPGTAFSEQELSKRVNIGRTPLREALQRLIADRLVISLPRRGMIVTEINLTEYLAILETRRELDRLIARKAAQRATPDQCKTLKLCAYELVKAAAANDISEFMRWDKVSDNIMEHACKNSFAVLANSPLHSHCRRFWYFYQGSGDLTTAADLHANLVKAVANQNADSAAAASDALLDYLEKFTRQALGLNSHP